MGDKYTVKSDLSVAAQHATAIGSANNHSAITVQRDEQTTVAGNNSAKNGISQFENLQTQLSNHIVNMIQNIHSLAEQFEDKDAMIRQNLNVLNTIQSKPSFSNEAKSKYLDVLED